MIRARMLAVAAGVAIAAPAHADDKPAMVPQRDVDVQYKIAGRTPDAQPRQQRIRWSVAQASMRIDPPSPGLYMIGNFQTGRMEVVKPADQSVLDMGPGSFNPHADPSFRKLGADQVGGLPCTNWQTADNGGRSTVLCLTSDGVMLRASHGDQVLVEASSVTYGPQDPAAFTAPESFRRIAPAAPPTASQGSK